MKDWVRKLLFEDISMDITPMIDVIFLLMIFLILMPMKEQDYRLEAHMPTKGEPTTKTNPPDIDPTYNIVITSKDMNEDEILSQVYFNQRQVCEFVTYSLNELNRIYDLPDQERKQMLIGEHKRDKVQFDPKYSSEISRLMHRMEDATIGTIKQKKTRIIIDASPKVPFKVVMAILNASYGAGYSNIGFKEPLQEIWAQDNLKQTPAF